jgi:hypothetical protein
MTVLSTVRHNDEVVDPTNFIALKDAVRYFPRPNGKRISLQTLYRWTSRGVGGTRLKTIRLGQQLCTCEAWVIQFISDLNRGSTIAEMTSSGKPTRNISRMVNDCLDRAGL